MAVYIIAYGIAAALVACVVWCIWSMTRPRRHRALAHYESDLIMCPRLCQQIVEAAFVGFLISCAVIAALVL